MSSLTIPWTDQMRSILTELQQRQLLRRLLAFAERHGVRLYIVGGTLRDLCVGRPVQDVDLTLAGDVISFARAFAAHVGAAYVPLDPERGEARVVYQKRDVIDLAGLKGDDIVADLHHRDFTINAMACPLTTLLTQAAPDLIDPQGGWQDLQDRVIRMVSSEGFRDDPLRLLRAFRLAASLEFVIDGTTLTAIESFAPRLGDVAAERIHGELLKVFAAPRSSPYVSTMARLGLLDEPFPELAATRARPQPVAEQADLFAHAILTYRCVEELMHTPAAYLPVIPDIVAAYLRTGERRGLIKWAALLHAIGNVTPNRDTAQQCQITSDVAARSAELWTHIGSRLKLSRQRVELIETLLAHDHWPFQLATLEAQGHLTLRLVHGWCKRLGEEILGVFLLAMGHALAIGQVDTPIDGVLALGQLAGRVWDLYAHRIVPVITAPRLVTGNDLQRIFHLSPGPRFKTLLDELELARIEGRIHTQTEALQWVEQQLSEP